MLQAFTTGQHVNGYRGISQFLALNNLIDIVWIFPIDKMHSIDLGVIKKNSAFGLSKEKVVHRE